MTTNELILAICRETGDYDGSNAQECIDGFLSNYPPSLVEDAAAGNVAALTEIRTGCGLPITC